MYKKYITFSYALNTFIFIHAICATIRLSTLAYFLCWQKKFCRFLSLLFCRHIENKSVISNTCPAQSVDGVHLKCTLLHLIREKCIQVVRCRQIKRAQLQIYTPRWHSNSLDFSYFKNALIKSYLPYFLWLTENKANFQWKCDIVDT